MTPDDFASVLGEPIAPANSDSSFEDSVLGRVGQSRPFLSSTERRRVRWVRMSIVGLAIGLFASAVLSMRAGLLPGQDESGVVSSIVSVAQTESLAPVETVNDWRDNALSTLVTLRESAQQANAESSKPSAVMFVGNRPTIRTERRPASTSYSVGFSMQWPDCPASEAERVVCQQVIVFQDGLTIPAGHAAASTQVTHWPNNVQESIEQLGLEGSAELNIGGILPPWYGSDVVRLPEQIQIGSTPDQSSTR
ncbi:MAG: hypothetical protein ED559_10840 [Phycisphaera sp.]|nr:MAG: hypothetical protein ED559_10840 [Phycisphaera sp.]